MMIKLDRRAIEAIRFAEENYDRGRAERPWLCSDKFRELKEIYAKSAGSAAYKYVCENPPTRWMIDSNGVIAIGVMNYSNTFISGQYSYPPSSPYPPTWITDVSRRGEHCYNDLQNYNYPPPNYNNVEEFAVHLSLVQFDYLKGPEKTEVKSDKNKA